MPPALDKNVAQMTPETAKVSGLDSVFILSLDSADVPLVLTSKAKQEFEVQGLEAMDDCLMVLTDRLTPANAPDVRPLPLDLVGQMMLDSAHNGNMRKLMLCALWLGHHYPSVNGLTANGGAYSFDVQT